MTKPGKIRILKIFIAGAFIFYVSIAVSFNSMAQGDHFAPPGLRLIQDPSIVIPANYHYPNQRINLPDYRDYSGNPKDGWSRKFIKTRRFKSDQSAIIFFRDIDFKRSITGDKKEGMDSFRFWPVESIIVIESYKGDAFLKPNAKLVEIAVMSKIKSDKRPSDPAFYPVDWSYAKFSPAGRPSFDSAELRQCHQCHSIAFHFTGDLIFTQFP